MTPDKCREPTPLPSKGRSITASKPGLVWLCHIVAGRAFPNCPTSNMHPLVFRNKRRPGDNQALTFLHIRPLPGLSPSYFHQCLYPHQVAHWNHVDVAEIRRNSETTAGGLPLLTRTANPATAAALAGRCGLGVCRPGGGLPLLTRTANPATAAALAGRCGLVGGVCPKEKAGGGMPPAVACILYFSAFISRHISTVNPIFSHFSRMREMVVRTLLSRMPR